MGVRQQRLERKACSAVFAHECAEPIYRVHVICWKKSSTALEESKRFGVKQPGSHRGHDKDKHTGKPFLTCVPLGQWPRGP